MYQVADVLRELEALVAEKGEEYVYKPFPSGRSLEAGVSKTTSCFYVHQNPETHQEEPGCIAGQVLYRAGMSLDALVQIEGKAVNTAAGVVEFLTSEAATVLRAAQMAQDAGDTWGSALEGARFQAANLRIPRFNAVTD